MTKTLIIIAETENGELTLPTLECVGEGREVANSLQAQVHVLLPGYQVAGLVDTLTAHGADQVTLIEHPALAQFSADAWLAALAPVLKETDALLALAPDTGHVRAWLPKLSIRWRIPLVSRCIQVRIIADGYPEMIRVTHDGARHERLVWPVATLAGVMLVPGIRGVSTPRLGRQAQVKHIEPQLDPSSFRDQTIRTLPADPRTVDIAEAERIVAGGLGLGKPEGVTELERLADLLNAALGGTRVISDRGWLPVERYIGTTGKIVAPKLYLGFGISGATQHLAGITGSEHIVAVNTDRTSPLLNMADLGIVGDLNEVVPILLEKLAKRKAQRSAKANVTDAAVTETSA